MTKNYRELADAGHITGKVAAQMQAARDAGRLTTRSMLAASGEEAEPAAFGMLDIIAVRLVAWYGPEAAAEVFAHYGAVCGRQTGSKTDGE